MKRTETKQCKTCGRHSWEVGQSMHCPWCWTMPKRRQFPWLITATLVALAGIISTVYVIGQVT